jgi:hypothetical protein
MRLRVAPDVAARLNPFAGASGSGGGLWRSLVSALRSGRRGPRFKSGQPDHHDQRCSCTRRGWRSCTGDSYAIAGPGLLAAVIEEVEEDPIRYLVLGPDRSGNFLELVILDRPQGPAVIHAMTMTAQYRRLLPGGS